MRRFATLPLYVLALAVLWLSIASGLFLWLGNLWDDPDVVWWSRPWQWLTYARNGDGSFSEMIYLGLSAFTATMVVFAIARQFLISPFRLDRPAVYGRTNWASSKEMSDHSLKSRRRPF
jgi:hypothetical protein